MTKFVAAVLDHLNINPEEVLVVRDSTVIVPNATVASDDELKILSVISGG